jgi:potassium large conductance calcium-activated channel subfamily M alpha protein 1
VDKSIVTIRTSLIEEIPSMHDHIILIGKDISNIYDFIKPLRAKYLGSCRSIVILYPQELPDVVWIKLSIFEAVYIVRGSGLEENDLRRAGVYRAQSVIVLAESSSKDLQTAGANESGGGGGGSGGGGLKSIDALADADSIFTYHGVKRMNDRANVVIEIVHTSNIGYLDVETQHDVNYKFSQQFASGMLFTSSLLDTLVCQSFYNPNIIRVVNKLISGLDQKEKGQENESHQADSAAAAAAGTAGAAAGTAPSSSSSAAENSGDAVNNGGLSKRLELFVSSCLYQIPIPEGLESKTYGSLFKYLSDRGMIPLGVLRGVFAHMNLGPRGNKLPYVFTNPSHDIELFSCDRIFVLSQKPPRSAIDLNYVKVYITHIHIYTYICAYQPWARCLSS